MHDLVESHYHHEARLVIQTPMVSRSIDHVWKCAVRDWKFETHRELPRWPGWSNCTWRPWAVGVDSGTLVGILSWNLTALCPETWRSGDFRRLRSPRLWCCNLRWCNTRPSNTEHNSLQLLSYAWFCSECELRFAQKRHSYFLAGPILSSLPPPSLRFTEDSWRFFWNCLKLIGNSYDYLNHFVHLFSAV